MELEIYRFLGECDGLYRGCGDLIKKDYFDYNELAKYPPVRVVLSLMRPT